MSERFLLVESVTEGGIEFDLVEFDPGWNKDMGAGYRKNYTDEEREIWENWNEWVMSANVGDEVRAECRVDGFDDSGVPIFEDCVKR